MTRKALVLAASLVLVPGVVPQEAGRDRPPENDAHALVSIDTLVTDKKGRTAPDLTRDDFELQLGEEGLEVATFDVECPLGVATDPRPLVPGKSEVPAPIGAGIERRIVFAFDYYTLSRTMRQQILKAADTMLQFAKTDAEEIMIVALASGVRIEQRFTADRRQLRSALTRMGHDSSLWSRDFPLGAGGERYFEDLITLMDVLEVYDGAKAVVLFSQLKTLEGKDRELDPRYDAVAMHAAAARSAIYPANPDSFDMDAGGGSEVLSRLAEPSGGRMPLFTNDVSLPYRQAQRDLSCRYTLGARLSSTQGEKGGRLVVKVAGRKLKALHPERFKLFTDEERRENRARAAFLDPGPYENPLVRTWAYPTLPVTESAWDTLLTLDFPLPVESHGTELNVAAEIRRGSTQVMKAERDLHVDPLPGGGPTRPVTIYADTTLRQGDHTLTVVMTHSAAGRVISATSHFQVPPVFEGLLVLRGPLFARAVPGGLLVRVDPEGEPEDARLRELLGENKSFQPLIVNEILASEELLYYWNACVFGTLDLEDGATVERRLMTPQGEVAYALEERSLKLAPRLEHENLRCQVELEAVPANTIRPGEYVSELLVKNGGGDVIGRSRAPLHVMPPRP